MEQDSAVLYNALNAMKLFMYDIDLNNTNMNDLICVSRDTLAVMWHITDIELQNKMIADVLLETHHINWSA